MTGNAAFGSPDPALATLTTEEGDLRQVIAERDALLQQAQAKTLAIRSTRITLETSLTSESGYVDKTVARLPDGDQAAAIASAGMAVAGDTSTPVSPMPKITGSPPPRATPTARWT